CLIGADLSTSDAISADFYLANLSSANLSKTRFYNANLSSANLSSAKLSETNLNKVEFNHTTFAWLDLSNVKGLETAIHRGPSTVNINSIVLPTDEYIRNHFLRGVGFTETQIEYLPSLLIPRPIQYHSLFISYATQDEAAAKQLYADLRKKDV